MVVEPGAIKTDWGIVASENLKKVSAKGTYAKSASMSADSMKEMYSGNRLTEPKVIVDANAFRRAFRNWTGMTSSEYRNKYNVD